MIGLSVKPHEVSVAEEFFQLFKTPWEIFDPAHSYDVVLSTGNEVQHIEARLLVVYSSRISPWDARITLSARKQHAGLVTLKGETLPLYGNVTLFGSGPEPGLFVSGKENVSRSSSRFSEPMLARIGYDLFSEVSFLLTHGQLSENAHYPTLDQHIAILRRVITDADIPVIEIPPAPAGMPFVACLTHDIDFWSLRQHRFDRTMFGFLLRATWGAALDACRGRIGLRRLTANWMAAAKLPLVHTGFCEDFWLPYERYVAADARPATYFLIPFKGRDGRAPNGKSSRGRATKCDITDGAAEVQMLRNKGCEVALHGIDAWDDDAAGRNELDRIRTVTGERPQGVRMHWLYFDSDSSRHLDAAGFDYDATCGYNEAVGYRAGTAQVFRPPGVKHLLELPFQIQDTALFFRDRMGLSEAEAWDRCLRLLQNSRRYGGVLTISWHDRSLVPERLWGDFYGALLNQIDAASPWFGTARDVVAWFRSRRAISFSGVQHSEQGIEINLQNVPPEAKPDFAVRLSWTDDCGQLRQKNVPVAGRNTVLIEQPFPPRALATCSPAA